MAARELDEGPLTLRSVRTWWDIVVRVYNGVSKHRTTGLAAEVAFFALFSLPPAFLSFFGALGFLGNALGADFTHKVQAEVIAASSTFLTKQAVDEVIVPTVASTLGSGRADILSLGLLFALFSASRASDALIEALNVVYDIDERITLWRRRALAIVFTVVGVTLGATLFPLMVLGPQLGRAIAAPLGAEATFNATWDLLYWPVVGLGTMAALTTTYHFAIPFRTQWRRDFPGAAFALGLWIAGSAGLRAYARWSVESSPIYGSLAAPMVLLLWLYYTSFSVLMGAELNSVIESMWPTISAKEKKRVLREAVAELAARGEEVEPVSVTGARARVALADAQRRIDLQRKGALIDTRTPSRSSRVDVDETASDDARSDDLTNTDGERSTVSEVERATESEVEATRDDRSSKSLLS